jgi:fused signal recognition particle receptor
MRAMSGFFNRLRQRLNRGQGLSLSRKLIGRKLDAALAEELETELLMADVGVEASERIINSLRKRTGGKIIEDETQARAELRATLVEILGDRASPLIIPDSPRPFLILIVGVNGSGKTTTIGKLARVFTDQGLKVILAAGDTYRAAAIEQLQAWGQRNNIPVIAQHPGADPAAVIFDAYEAAQARGADVVLADTAGRLQSQTGLMDELAKVVRVAGRLDPSAPHEKMLVLDASLGQNAVTQAIEFNEAIGLTGITITKLDSGAKGGVLLAIGEKLNVPFRFIGVGEEITDMDVFDAEQFAAALINDGDQ